MIYGFVPNVVSAMGVYGFVPKVGLLLLLLMPWFFFCRGSSSFVVGLYGLVLGVVFAVGLCRFVLGVVNKKMKLSV